MFPSLGSCSRSCLVVGLLGLWAMGCGDNDPAAPPMPKPLADPPAILSIEPDVAATTGGERLTITGRGFARGVTVTIAGAPAEGVYWRSATEITARAPARLGVRGRVPVQARNPDGSTAERDDLFAYYAGDLRFSRTDFTGGTYGRLMRLLDLDRDGRQDLVVAWAGAGVMTPESTASVMLGAADGTFTFAGEYPGGEGLSGLGIGDVDGDGMEDLAMASERRSIITVYHGLGGGGFIGRMDYPTGKRPVALVMADFNGDRRQDIVTANADGYSLTVLLSTLDGRLILDTVRLPLAPAAMATSDVDGDGLLDLILALSRTTEVAIWKGLPGGKFIDAKTEYQVGPMPSVLTLGDIDGDRAPDLVVGNWGSSSFTVLLGRGDGGFTVKGTTYAGGAPNALALGDVNGDHKADLVIGYSDSKTVGLFLGLGGGRFQVAKQFEAPGHAAGLLALDAGGDGLADLIVAGSGRSYSLMRNLSQ